MHAHRCQAVNYTHNIVNPRIVKFERVDILSDEISLPAVTHLYMFFL